MAGTPAPSPARGAPPGGAGDADGQTARDARRIAELEQQLERRVREAQAAGHREGEAAGRAMAAAALQPVLDKLARGIQEIAGLRPQVVREATAELVNLSLGIARRILHRELSIDPAAPCKSCRGRRSAAFAFIRNWKRAFARRWRARAGPDCR